MTSAPMLKSLLSDTIVRSAIAIWTVFTLFMVVPAAPRDWVAFYSEHLLDLPFLPLIVAAAWFGIRRLEDEAEQRFWRVLGYAAMCSLAVSVGYAILDPSGRWTLPWKIGGDLAYLAGYVLTLVAIEQRPHQRKTGSLGDRERQLRTFGLIVISFFLVVYFVVVPAAFTGQSYEEAVPSFYLFIAMDVLIVYRLWGNRRDAWSIRWSWIYTWLLVAYTLSLVADLVEFASYRLPFEMPVGTSLDLLWTTPLAVLAIGIRARHVAFPAEQRVLNEATAPRSPLRAGHLLLLGALFMPVLHVALTMTHQLEPGTSDTRELVSVLSLVAMGVLALAAYRVLEFDREQMEAKEIRLVSELGVARKMDAVARLAASVAHDFNNLIHIIQGRTDVIAEQLPEDDPLQEEIREINAASGRATDLAGQLMAFGRTQPTSPATVRLHDLLGRAEQLLKPLLDDKTRLKIRLGATQQVVRLDPLQFERVILNLVTNARDAMPGGGSVTIETFNPGFESLGGQPYTDSSVVRIVVSDTGMGMERDTIAHIFEPFFTTKEGRGAGLGLAITHGLIQQAGGSITVESQPQVGTSFTITLPVVRGAEPSPVSQLSERPEPPGAVLIIEMDATNRQLLRRLLVDLERPVLTAATGPEALHVASRYPGPIDLAVVDITCEGGRTIASELRETETGMRALILAQDQPITTGELDVLLREPFELGDVLRAAKRLVFAR